MCRFLAQPKKLNSGEGETSYERKKGLSVHFNTNCTNDVDVTIHEISKPSQKEIEDSWYSYDEYQEIKSFFLYVVFAIDMKDDDSTGHFDSNSKFNDAYNNDVDSTIWGLENQTAEGKWERHVHRQDCNFAVFDIQDEQIKMKEKARRLKRFSMNHTKNYTDNSSDEEYEISLKYQYQIAEACVESTEKATQLAQERAVKLSVEVLNYYATPTTITATSRKEEIKAAVVNTTNTKNKCDKNLKALCSHWDREKENGKDELINDASTGYKTKAKGRRFNRRSSLPTRMSEPPLTVDPSLMQQCDSNRNFNKAEIDHKISNDNQGSTFIDSDENDDSNKSTAVSSGPGVTTTTTTNRAEKASDNIRKLTKGTTARRSSMPRLSSPTVVSTAAMAKSLNNTKTSNVITTTTTITTATTKTSSDEICVIKPTMGDSFIKNEYVKRILCTGKKASSDRELRSTTNFNENDISDSTDTKTSAATIESVQSEFITCDNNKVDDSGIVCHDKKRGITRRLSMPLLSTTVKSKGTAIKSRISIFDNMIDVKVNCGKSVQQREYKQKRRISIPISKSIKTNANTITIANNTTTVADDGDDVVPRRSVFSKISLFNNLDTHGGLKINRKTLMVRRSSLPSNLFSAVEREGSFRSSPRRCNSDSMKITNEFTMINDVRPNNANKNEKKLGGEIQKHKTKNNENSSLMVKPVDVGGVPQKKRRQSLPFVLPPSVKEKKDYFQPNKSTDYISSHPVISKISLFDNLGTHEGLKINRKKLMERRSSLPSNLSGAVEREGSFRLCPRRCNSDNAKVADKVAIYNDVRPNNANKNDKKLKEKKKKHETKNEKDSSLMIKPVDTGEITQEKRRQSLPLVLSLNAMKSKDYFQLNKSNCTTLQPLMISQKIKSSTDPTSKNHINNIISNDKNSGDNRSDLRFTMKKRNESFKTLLLASGANDGGKVDIKDGPISTEQQQPTTSNVSAIIACIQSKNNLQPYIYIQSTKELFHRDSCGRMPIKRTEEYSAFLKKRIQVDNEQYDYEAMRNSPRATAA